MVFVIVGFRELPGLGGLLGGLPPGRPGTGTATERGGSVGGVVYGFRGLSVGIEVFVVDLGVVGMPSGVGHGIEGVSPAVGAAVEVPPSAGS